MIRRLGQRLDHLYRWALAAGPFDDIWDLCCDHGRLGLHLHQALREQAAPRRGRVHLVDQAPQPITELRAKYAPLMDGFLHIACMDAANVFLLTGGRQLVVIAGVGGGTIVSLLTELFLQLQTAAPDSVPTDVRFLLSPNSNAFQVRGFLRQHNFESLDEELVTEKGWSHEHMHVRYRALGNPDRLVSEAGSGLWQPMTPEKNRYLRKQWEHYRKRARFGGQTDAQRAVEIYRGLMVERE